MTRHDPMRPTGGPDPAPVGPASPFSIELEQAILGGLLINNLSYQGVGKILRPDHFSQPLHALIYGTIERLILERSPPPGADAKDYRPASMQIVKAALGDIEVEGKPISTYLARLAAEAITIVNMPDFARLVVDLSIRRKLIDACSAIQSDAAKAGLDRSADQVVSEASQAIQAVGDQSTILDTRKPLGVAVGLMLNKARAIMDGAQPVETVPSGFDEIDSMTGGFQPGTLWIAGARPGMGKTSLMISCANNVGAASVRRERSGLEGWGVLEFSLEVPEEQLVCRHLADLTYIATKPIQFGRMMRGDLNDAEMWRLQDAHRRLDEMPVVIDVAARLSVAEIGARIRIEKGRFQRQGVALKVVFIDYLKFIKASDRYRGNRVYEVGEISGSLKQMAKQEGVCIVLLVQLNRGLEAREDKRPGLSDLRDSGDLEADADVVIFLHRESYFIEKTAEYRRGDGAALESYEEARFRAELIVGKNRAGPTRTATVHCDMASSTLRDGAG